MCYSYSLHSRVSPLGPLQQQRPHEPSLSYIVSRWSFSFWSLLSGLCPHIWELHQVNLHFLLSQFVYNTLPFCTIPGKRLWSNTGISTVFLQPSLKPEHTGSASCDYNEESIKKAQIQLPSGNPIIPYYRSRRTPCKLWTTNKKKIWVN